MKDKYLTALPYLLAAVVFAGCLILGFPAFSGFLEVLLAGSALNALELFACLLLDAAASFAPGTQFASAVGASKLVSLIVSTDIFSRLITV